MGLFVLLSFIFLIKGLPDTQNILCSNKKTADQIIFSICSFDKYCSEIYNIPFFNMYNNNNVKIDIKDNNEFTNFNYIVSKIGLSYPLSVSTYISDSLDENVIRTIKINTIDMENGLYNKLWSSEWRRTFTRINFIVFNGNGVENIDNNFIKENKIISRNEEISSDTILYIENLINFNQYENKCLFMNTNNISTFLFENFFNQTDGQNINNIESLDIINPSLNSWNTILSHLYILSIFKEHISSTEVCDNINEKLYFDIDTNEAKCVCLENKICDAESNDTNTVLWVILLGLGVLVIVCLVLIYTSGMIISRVSDYKKTKKN